MSNFIGAARSNYVMPRDLEALRAALKPFPIEIAPSLDEDDGMVCLLSRDDNGSWPSMSVDEDDNEIELDVPTVILPHLAPNQVFVVMQAGFERLRYVGGWAEAWHVGSGASVHIALHHIYEKAKEAFGIEPTPAEY